MTLQTQYVELPTTSAVAVTEAQQRRRRNMATLLCRNALNGTSWRLADRLSVAWECGGCEALGVKCPDEVSNVSINNSRKATK